MRYLFLLLLLPLLWLPSGQAYGQATVYLANGSRVAGQIENVTRQTVTVLPGGQTTPAQYPRREVLALFNQKGDFLLLDSSSKAPDSLAVRRFLHPDDKDLEADIIIARNGKSTVGHITGEDMNLIYAEARGGVRYDWKKAQLAAVVRKDGRHQVFGPIAPLMPALRTAGAEMASLRAQAREMKLIKVKESDEELPFDKTQFEHKILQKVDDLGRYVRIIADKQTALDEANRTINLACALFLDEDRLVEVTQPNKASEIYKVRPYLNKLKLLRYQDVRVSWYNVSFVSKLRKGPDGRFYGTVSFDQRFEGYQEGKLVYSDKVRKNIEIVVAKYTKVVDGQEEEGWEVYLSDIGVKRSV